MFTVEEFNLQPFFSYLNDQDYTWETEEISDNNYLSKVEYTISNQENEQLTLTIGVVTKNKTLRDDGKVTMEMNLEVRMSSMDMSEKECTHLTETFSQLTGVHFSNIIN